MAPERELSFMPLLCKIVNGGIAGITGVSIIYPIDLVKTRLQNQNTTSGQKLYENMFDCFKKSYRASGYWGMYRGSAVNILLVTPEKAIKLTTNDIFRYMLLDERGKLTLLKEMTAGGLAGLCQTVVTTPMELLKIQMQLGARTQTGTKVSALQLTLNVLKSQGVTGLYKGCLSTILRDVSFSIIYFPLFAHLKSLGRSQHGADDVTCQAPFYWSFVSGCAAGGFAAVAVNPIDVVKTRLQAQSQSMDKPSPTAPNGPSVLGRSSDAMKPGLAARDPPRLALLNSRGDPQSSARNFHQPAPAAGLKYNGIADAFVRISREEGWRAFFKGGSCRVLVIAPLFGIAQTVYFFGIGEYLLGVK